MNTPNTPQPTKVGAFTIWVIIGLVAIVIIALALAFSDGGTGAGQPPEPVRDQGFSMSGPAWRA